MSEKDLVEYFSQFLKKDKVKSILDEFFENVVEIGINSQTKRIEKLYEKLGLEY